MNEDLKQILRDIREKHGVEVEELCKKWYLTGVNDAMKRVGDFGAETQHHFESWKPS